MTTSTSTTGKVSATVLKCLLGILVLANIIVWSALPVRDKLVEAGVLPPSPPQRVDLDWQTLPPFAAQESPGVELGDGGFGDEPTGIAPPDDVHGDEGGEHTSEAPAEELLACLVAGPFESREAAVATRDHLASSGVAVELLEEPMDAQPQYLVYVEPVASREAALLTVRELRAQSIEDAFVIRSGARENGVSVGFFASRDLAVRHRERVAELGYAVSIRTRNSDTTIYLLRARNVPVDAFAEFAYVPCESGRDG